MKLKEYTNLTLTLISPNIYIYFPHPQKFHVYPMSAISII